MRIRFRVALLLVLVVGAMSAVAQGKSKNNHDNFYWLGEFNKASTVMVGEQGIVPKPLAAKIARGVAQVIADGDKPGAKRPGDYLQLEPLIIAVAGPDATRMHSGRSRQDILATTRRVMLRERVLDLADSMDAARDKLIALASRNVSTIVPAYTNGVQAQPTSYAHYLLAFAAAFARDGERLRQVYARLNLSPLGSAALGTSSFPVNRPRLAELLGFDGVLENSYDATQVSTLDLTAEIADVASISALTVGNLAQDMHTQYHQTNPWIMLTEGALTGTSSIMPQKRNPYALNILRLEASTVVGDAQTVIIQGHNVTPGMPDYKREGSQKTLEEASEMFGELSRTLDGLIIDPERALAEVNADYSTTTELADVLQREADVPFRVGHHFASELVNFGRANHLKPAEIPYADAVRIYAEAGTKYDLKDLKLPLSEQRFRTTLTPENMVNGSLGLGGPQPAEVKRMLEQAKQRLANDRAWTKSQRDKLAAASANLDRVFGALAQQN
jgi:argininosuccinate lyase